MKKIVLLLLMFAVVWAGYAQNIQPKPNPPQAVNDFAHLLEPFQKDALEQKLRAYNDSTSSAIVIITVNDLDGHDIAEVALKYLRDWGIGVKGKNNGVVILVAKNEKRARIETGYGMEGVLPDITSKHIIDDEMAPSFRSNDFYGGLDHAVDAIIKAAAGEYKADAQDKKSDGGGVGIVFLVIFIIIMVIFLGRRGGGGGGGQYMSRRGSRSFLDVLPWFLMGNLMGRGGRGGGGWGGGGFGGGGFGGGGFGGFGGGSGGGGGASGGW